MVSKKSLVVGLLAVAVLLSVFSLAMSFSVDSLNPKGQTQQTSDLGGNVNLEILPVESAMVVSDGASR